MDILPADPWPKAIGEVAVNIECGQCRSPKHLSYSHGHQPKVAVRGEGGVGVLQVHDERHAPAHEMTQGKSWKMDKIK